MQKLPLGISTFRKIIEKDCVYVDKTKMAYDLVTKGEYYFLSRPRRFGKSLFLDTLKEVFEGNKALFKGLYIYDKWDWDDRHPVMKISLGSGGGKTINELREALHSALDRVEEDLDIVSDKDRTPGHRLAHMIRQACDKTGKKVVILIDEYDKPIVDNIEDREVARMMRDEMKSFYSIIKDHDSYIRFVFLTGVSKFSKMSLFSGLNNLQDITLNPKYGNICGYTHDDLKTTFGPYLEGVDLEKVRKWYNGYNFFGEKVYNPYDILLFIENGHQYLNHWWSTGTPSFLVKLLKQKDYSLADVENYEATDEILNSFDVDNISLEALLWQTGYLTIREKFEEANLVFYKLEVPNVEVQTSLNTLFIETLTTHRSEGIRYKRNLFKILERGDLDGLGQMLKGLFASIPYHNFTNNKIANYEGYYASVIYAYMASLGFYIIAEDASNKSRVDMTLRISDKTTYIFEFKVVEAPTGSAMKQIKEKGYYKKYNDSPCIYLIGIECSREERNIIHYEWEKWK